MIKQLIASIPKDDTHTEEMLENIREELPKTIARKLERERLAGTYWLPGNYAVTEESDRIKAELFVTSTSDREASEKAAQLFLNSYANKT